MFPTIQFRCSLILALFQLFVHVVAAVVVVVFVVVCCFRSELEVVVVNM